MKATLVIKGMAVEDKDVHLSIECDECNFTIDRSKLTSFTARDLLARGADRTRPDIIMTFKSADVTMQLEKPPGTKV